MIRYLLSLFRKKKSNTDYLFTLRMKPKKKD